MVGKPKTELWSVNKKKNIFYLTQDTIEVFIFADI